MMVTSYSKFVVDELGLIRFKPTLSDPGDRHESVDTISSPVTFQMAEVNQYDNNISMFI